ncbi:MAG: hypothetical protein ACRDF0_00535, partial [Candidatus Limnocylindria bacterium]
PATAAPRTPAPTAPPTTAPPATTISDVLVALPDGTLVRYQGPTSIGAGRAFSATLTVTRADGSPLSGAFSLFLFDPQLNTAAQYSGALDATGRATVDMAAPANTGDARLRFSSATTGNHQIALIRIH